MKNGRQASLHIRGMLNFRLSRRTGRVGVTGPPTIGFGFPHSYGVCFDDSKGQRGYTRRGRGENHWGSYLTAFHWVTQNNNGVSSLCRCGALGQLWGRRQGVCFSRKSLEKSSANEPPTISMLMHHYVSDLFHCVNGLMVIGSPYLGRAP